MLAIARDHALIDARSYDAIAGSYAYLRQVVNRLQILDGVSRHELPDGDELEAFARRMGYSSGGGLGATGQLSEELEWHRHSARKMFDKYVV